MITKDNMLSDPAAPQWSIEAISAAEDDPETVWQTVCRLQEIMELGPDTAIREWGDDVRVPIWGRQALTAFVEARRGFARFRAWADVELLRRALRPVFLDAKTAQLRLGSGRWAVYRQLHDHPG